MKKLKKANTMIEFIVILVIMIILGAVVATNMSSTKKNTGDTITLANMEKVIAAENSFKVLNGNFTDTVSQLGDIQNITLTNGNSTSGDVISLFVSNDNTLYIAALSDSELCLGKKISVISGLEEKIEDISLESTESCSADSLLG